MVDKVQEVMGGRLEGRLAIQYAMTIILLCAQEVRHGITYLFSTYNAYSSNHVGLFHVSIAVI